MFDLRVKDVIGYFSLATSMRNSAWIWFVGCAVWVADGAVQLHFGARAHARVAIMLAMLFLVAGLFYRRQKH